MIKYWLVACSLMLFGGTAFATPVSETTIAELANKLGYVAVNQNMREYVLQQLDTSPRTARLEPAVRQCAADVMLEAGLDWSLEPLRVVFASFGEAEAKSWLQFFDTPVGQRLASDFKVVLWDSVSGVQPEDSVRKLAPLSAEVETFLSRPSWLAFDREVGLHGDIPTERLLTMRRKTLERCDFDPLRIP